MPDLRSVKPTKHILPISFGKDSISTAILCHELGLPIDEALFSEVMFSWDPPVSGENVRHISFIKEKAIPKLESWGIKVTILHSDKCYLDCFTHVIKHARQYPEHEGMAYGFPGLGCCVIQRDLKVRPMEKHLAQTRKEGFDIVSYIGYTADEPIRLKRLEGTNNVSILARYGLTQKDTYALAKKYDLLSPIYNLSGRGGCWMCGYAKDEEILDIMHGPQKEAWDRFVSLEDMPNIIYRKWSPYSKETLHERDQRLKGL